MANIKRDATSGKILRNASGLISRGCPVFTCAEFDTCFGRSGSTVTQDIELTLSGIANNNCTTCGDYNDTYIFSSGTYSTPFADTCQAFYGPDDFGKTACSEYSSSYTLQCRIRLDDTPVSGLTTIQVDFYNLDDQALFYPAGATVESDYYDAIVALCNGETINLDVSGGFHDACDLSSATGTLALV